MSSGSSASKRLRRLAKEIPDDRHLGGLLRIIEDRHLGSDYAVAVMGASMIERALETSIISRFVPLSPDERNRMFGHEHRGPLADLSARIRMAAAMGLFGPKTYADLDHIRHVRNAFAHSPSILTFAHDDIAAICLGMNIIKVMTLVESGGQSTPKGNYVSACLGISGRLRTRLAQQTNNALARYAWTPRNDGLLP